MTRLARWLVFPLVVACFAASGFAHAQGWPSRPVKLIVPYPPGGIGDGIARALALRLSAKTGQPFVVENQPGGNQIPATAAMGRSAPDGHTLLLASPTNLILNPLLQKAIPYDADKFTLISTVATSPFFVLTEPKLPANSIPELIALAKSKPGALAYGSNGEGSSSHLAVELFNQMAGIRMTHVPYKGTSQTNIDLMNGTLQLVFFPAVGSLPLVKDGRLKLLAVTSGRRSAAAPDVPTIAEAGLRDYVVEVWFGLAGPEGMPKLLTEQIAAAVRQALEDPALNRDFAAQAVEFEGSTPEAFRSSLQRERKLWASLVRTLNLKPQ
ncbi:Bug family tripartite tricarboxylate transporter substrate binding protein [Ramlibacter albus]|uniref:Tripartite tricarboxylate transporter substrate binding protein n=1 Tax=Ramlibacter albus TaxID=2079448 RepID=A0A923S095_9BURK|nr:tripartite tricarboxylate transporter substrate binding protein [Ramlibacter albus]MBC5763025.1 tripartite tricarboxylate transporter substrate binding protein [Ramlibacter albus]